MLLCEIFSFSQNEPSGTLNNLQQQGLGDSAKAELYTHLAYFYQRKNIDSAIVYSTRAISIATISHSAYALAHAYNQQAGNYVWNFQQDTALSLYLKSVSISKNAKADETLFFAYIGIAYLYETTRNLDKSLSYSKLALILTDNINRHDLDAFAYHELAGIYMGLNNYIDAYKYFTSAKKGFENLKNEERLGECCSEMSRLFIALKQYPQAQAQLDSALQIFNSQDEPIQAAEVYEGYGLLYTSMKQFDVANINFMKAMQIYAANNMDDDKNRIEMNSGKMLLAKNQFDQAKNLLTRVYGYYKSVNDKENQLQIIMLLAIADSALGNHAAQYSYLSSYKNLSDSLNEQRSAQRTKELLVEFDAERQAKENEKLRKENDESRSWTWISAGTGILFLFGAIYIFILFRQKTKANIKLQNAQKKADEAYTELKEVSGMKDKLFSILAHDLRSPLANTSNLLQLTKSGAIDKDVFAQLASELEVNLDYNRELLDNVLTWARSQMQGIHISKKKINLSKIVNSNILLAASIADKKNVKIVNEINDQVEVFTDENILQLALRNTISNAIKFSTQGKQIILSSEKKSDKVMLQVKDSGIGISDDDLKNIFTIHTQSRRGTQSEKGAGIGLRISREMIEKMDGNITIVSKASEGTSVFIELETA